MNNPNGSNSDLGLPSWRSGYVWESIWSSYNWNSQDMNYALPDSSSNPSILNQLEMTIFGSDSSVNTVSDTTNTNTRVQIIREPSAYTVQNRTEEFNRSDLPHTSVNAISGEDEENICQELSRIAEQEYNRKQMNILYDRPQISHKKINKGKRFRVPKYLRLINSTFSDCMIKTYQCRFCKEVFDTFRLASGHTCFRRRAGRHGNSNGINK
ncbi:uncharacterized protein LOC106668672 isoform X2 [Cimex lectularius]|uniref:Uncharacterized protein n=1 Tax=Cimex lectularius TaxID=79782 RepID=A0A8I6RVD4_CIMLE|nr:uncharacterized protein LOC106668672 isoform X2 [Cimex lectularius]